MALLKGPFGQERALLLEWALPSPVAGYSSSTIAFANTRKQHGLLVADKNGARHLLVSKLEETLKAGGAEHALSCNQYPGAIFPDGHARLSAFSSLPLPTFAYSAGESTVEKTVFPVGGRNAFGVRYAVFSKSLFSMRIRPMLCFRKSNEVAKGRQEYVVEAGSDGKSVKARCGSLEASVLSDQGAFSNGEEWFNDMQYPRDAERQNECSESLYSPGEFLVQSEGDAEFFVVACEGTGIGIDAKAEFAAALARAKRVTQGAAPQSDGFLVGLLHAADSFVAKPDGRATIIAGYPWFGEWGRDSMVSLPGLLLSTGRLPEARQVLERFASRIKDGEVPNQIGEAGEPQYNSVDASLWLIRACALYLEASRDTQFERDVFLPAARKIVEAYAAGTPSGIAVDGDGLLIAGKQGSALTWMDVKLEDGTCPTPRWGKPVEVNALWYHALMTCEELFRRADGKFSSQCGILARKCNSSFSKFYNKEKQCLYDVIDPVSDKVRPNQIFAVSLAHSPLSQHERDLVFRKVTSELFTPLGLRTLSPKDPEYRGKYQGSQRERDFAYHNGCAWPWLIGAYIGAKLRVDFDRKASLGILMHFKPLLEGYGVGSLPEVCEGDTLRPDGCISQAWSVAEVLRCYLMLR